jgi:hypothetical protein
MSRRFRIIAPALLLALATAAPAAAKRPVPRTCAAMAASGHERDAAGRLREARWFFLKCATAACGPIQTKCASAAAALNASIASIVPVVTDATGALLVDVEVKVDGEPLTTKLDGRPLAVDPGVREFSFRARTGDAPGAEVSLTRKIMILERQRGALPIELPPPTVGEAKPSVATSDEPAEPAEKPSAAADATQIVATPPVGVASSTGAPLDVPARSGGSPALGLVLGGAGVLGLAAGALLTYWGKTDNDSLARCAPNCAPASLDHIRTMYLASDISFGVGGAALGAAALVLALSHRGAPAASAAAKASPAQRAFVFDLGPTRGGGVVSFGGVF